jgi:hypothetical protein
MYKYLQNFQFFWLWESLDSSGHVSPWQIIQDTRSNQISPQFENDKRLKKKFELVGRRHLRQTNAQKYTSKEEKDQGYHVGRHLQLYTEFTTQLHVYRVIPEKDRDTKVLLLGNRGTFC